MPQPKREATFQVQNLHLNRFINPKVQIQRREGRKGRHEEFGESGTKIAPLNTSFLFWTFSQRLLNLPRFIEGKKKKFISFTTPLRTDFEETPLLRSGGTAAAALILRPGTPAPLPAGVSFLQPQKQQHKGGSS